jgi:hypothetical protein
MKTGRVCVRWIVLADEQKMIQNRGEFHQGEYLYCFDALFSCQRIRYVLIQWNSSGYDIVNLCLNENS